MVKRNLTIKSSRKNFLLKKQNHNFTYEMLWKYWLENVSYLGMSFVTKLGALGYHMQFTANW